MSQHIDVLRKSIGIGVLDELSDPFVQRCPGIVSDALIGRFLSDRVFELVLRLGLAENSGCQVQSLEMREMVRHLAGRSGGWIDRGDPWWLEPPADHARDFDGRF